ncbi:MAG: signal recognition particle-docking protein FtsY, partial [Lachnospiraceae bacterium]|nr:signal recognition particle-docking protein FtsY [Lachnospiraceae bacterium]
MFGFGKKKKEEENIISDYDLLNNSNAEEVYDDFGNPKYLKDGEDPFLNGKDDGEDIPDEYLADDEEAVTEEYHPEDSINDDSDNSDILSEEPEKKKGFFARLKEGLTKSRNSFAESFANLFKANEIDDDFYDELEETLVMADLGVETTERIIDDLKDKVKEQKIKEAEACKQLIVNIIRDQMSVDDTAYDFEDKKTVVLVIGVNGVGKTTSIGKLAAQYKKRGKKVLMAAADTFRAAAIDQLKTWSNRAGVDIIAQGEGADPSAVVYDAVSAAKSRNTDILLIDTAGRLHNKKNLMDELGKMRRVISREYPEANVESLIVLDGTTGQNALEQARQFSSVTEINGIIITKLDGTA